MLGLDILAERKTHKETQGERRWQLAVLALNLGHEGVSRLGFEDEEGPRCLWCEGPSVSREPINRY